MTTRLPALCDSCTRRTGEASCEAFDQIPVEIVALSGDHRQPVEGDGGIVYEQDPDKVEAFDDWLSMQPVGNA